MKDSLFQTAKFWLVDATGLAKDALHIHVGLIVFFAAALIFRWPLRSWRPWAAALAAALAGEAWDLWESLSEGRRILLWANWKDVWNTMLWPSAILLLARGTRLFGTGRR
ncbi:hypothetical protein DAH66_15685 [Sphingomonas koreensis]|uniref:VanZ-like domain-containing protein n=1 Tax=Sphingomonas koreensis TaxID=93064 RepID=A0A430G0P6_9SPHN|nr:hypothetical protein [Sphingomonas koreensis]RSY80610.1 hypothetical protein DAH66_15685 [Sphingomonas koreensis]